MAQVIETVFSIRTEESVANLNEVVGALGKTEQAAKKAAKTASDEMEKIPAATKKAVSGFNGLSNSINQVSRELPAFAFSAQTGFLAISNNLPILADEITNLRKANEALAAQGKSTIPIWQQVATSLFSWQTALSLGISLMVIYGKELGAFFSSLLKGSGVISEAELRLKGLNEAYKSSELKTNITALNTLTIRLYEARKGYIDKNDIIKEYNELLGVSFGKVNSLNEVEAGLIANTPAYITAMVQRTAGLKLAQDAALLAIELEEEKADVLKENTYLSSKDLELLIKRNAPITQGIRDIRDEMNQTMAVSLKFQLQADAVIGGVPSKVKDAKNAWEALRLEITQTESLLASNKLNKIDSAALEANYKKIKEDYKKIQDYLDELNGEAEKRRQKAREEARKKFLKDDQDDTARNEKLLKQTIDNELLANKEKYSQIRNSKKLTDLELLKLSQAETDAEIEILERFREANVETNKQLIADKDKSLKIQSDTADLYEKKNKEARDKATETLLLELDTTYVNLRQGKILNNEEDRKLEIEKQKGVVAIIKAAYDQDLTYAKQLQQERNKLKLMENKDLETSTKEALDKELLANDVYFENLKVGKEENVAALQAIETDRLNKNLEILEKYKQKGLEVDKEILDSNTKLGKSKIDNAKREAKERKEIEKEVRDALLSLAKTLSDDLFKNAKTSVDNETQIKLDALQKERDNKLITESDFEVKKKQILNQQAQTQRQLDLSQIKINTALAVIKTLAVLGLTPAGYIAAGLALAEGVAAYSIAQSQPLPRFAKGTDRVQGGIAGQDSVHALLMPNEAVIPAKANMERQGLAKAWIGGDLDRHLAMNYINPAINEVNRKWETSLRLNQQSTFIRNDNFNDRKIVGELIKSNRINKHIANSLNEKTVKSNNKRLWS